MICKKCGNQLTVEDKFCKKCGQSVEQTTNTNVETQGVNNVQQPTYSQVQNVGQPTNNYQTSNYASSNNPTYSKKETNPIIYVVITLLVIGVIGFVVFFFFKDKIMNLVNSNDDNNQVVTISSTKVSYAGYTFSIPVNYITEIGDNLAVYDDTEEWVTYIEVIDDTNYATLKTRIADLKASFESDGITLNSMQEKTINDNSWIIFEYQSQGYNVLGGYGKTINNKVVTIETFNSNNTFDTNRFSEFEKICSSATVSTNKGITSTETNKNIGIEVIKNFK